jgi:para-aminobenzoate synthetase/4-amino-4-deoxychorismate lyase
MNMISELSAAAPRLSLGDLVLHTESGWIEFSDPVRTVSTHVPGEVAACLREVDWAVSQAGLYAAGFMCYEAAAAYELAVHEPEPEALPLLWFGLYERAERLRPLSEPSGAYELGAWQASLDEATYHKAIEQIKQHIARGDTYQVNFTMRMRASFSGDPWGLFCDLSRAQQAGHAAFLDTGRYVICSASPELFFHLDGDLLRARPMKGTGVRGRTLAEDEEHMAKLQRSAKDRAENVMIVDMIRNDFGRIAGIGSVNVPELFTVERYPTLLQMTSTVTARSQAALPAIMEAVFPCASITGAPKVRTMEIIKALEPDARGIYTGAIGYWGPDRQASFNVAIRTVVVDRLQGTAQYGVGSGIVWDSDAAAEYAECRLKSQILTTRFPVFELLESLLWTPEEGFFLLEMHLARLAESAQYFDFHFEEAVVRRRLMETAVGLTEASKVRLLLVRSGEMAIEAQPLGVPAEASQAPVCLASAPVDSGDVWLYHKTSRRQVYEQALAACPDGYEALLWNERGEITEATSANVVVELDGELVTPPVSAGLLAGTYRRFLLEQGLIREKRVTRSDLERCTRLALINSVRKWREAVLVECR